MNNTDKKKFSEMLDQMYAMYGKPFTDTTLGIWWKIFERFEMNEVTEAFSAAIQKSKYLPVPATILEILDPNKWPAPSEAWANHPKDERETGAICNETLAAWASAEPVMDDHIAARKAFEGAYQRHVDAALREGRRSPKWRLSLGWDAGSREAGALAAMKAGLLTAKQTRGLIGHEKNNTARLTDDREERRGDLRHVRGFLGWADGTGAD